MSPPPPTVHHTHAEPRVMHVVSGGFSGATQVALDLVQAAAERAHTHGDAPPVGPTWLVLRRKRSTDMKRVEALRGKGLDVRLLPGGFRLLTLFALVRLLRALRPDVLVAHGFPEHLIARWAGWWVGVPVMVHVEHNARERYGAWSLLQARFLARRTAAIVGCSEGVRTVLLGLGFEPARTLAIPNGIRLEPYAVAGARPWAERVPGIVMAARFARQKDQATLIEALALLRARGLRPTLLLAGGGKASLRRQCEAQVKALGLQDQVQFLGQHPDVPALLCSHQLCVLSTRWEGMPLALVEGMAAGCAVVGSDVVGVRELLRDGENGRLVPAGDPVALADALAGLLTTPETAATMAAQARRDALQHHGKNLMAERYSHLFDRLHRDARG